jgi:CheY-like chemotaxis protein
MSRILVVDDEVALTDLVSAILKGAGYEVLTANSGVRALEVLETERVDLLLLDVMMPEMDGWAVVKEVKNRPLIKDTPIAMLTVKTLSPQYFYSEEIEGIVDYINKPFSKDELIERVQSVIEDVDKMRSVKSELKTAPPDFMKDYDEIVKTEKLYENLNKSLEFSLTKIDKSSKDYNILKDALNYGKVLLERVRERKKTYNNLIKKD